jgi:Enoyl-(Acyl carrier protein) reductase
VGTAPSADDGGYAHWGAVKGGYRPLHAISGAGFLSIRDPRELHSPRCDRDRADHGDGHYGQQSNRDRAELIALRRLGTVEDCAKVVEFLATELSDYVTGAGIPIDGGYLRG